VYVNFTTACILGNSTQKIGGHEYVMHMHVQLLALWKNHFTNVHTVPSLSMIVTLAVSLPNWTAESLVKSITPNCSCSSSIMRSSSMVMLLQSCMSELVNVSWAVVLAKSIGAARGEGGLRVTHTNYINVSGHKYIPCNSRDSVSEKFTNC